MKQHLCSSKKGFTVLELLVCIVILAFFVTIVAMNTGKFDEDVKIAAALKDMKAIQTAIVNGLYPDLGYIPCGIKATDSDERKELEGLFVPTYLFLKREAFKKMLYAGEQDQCVKEGYIDPWDKYESKGWQNPYMKGAGGSLDATYFDEDNFPKRSEGQHVYLPAMLTPWAERCEEMAREAEKEGDPDLAKEYRRGKYYQVFYPQVTFTRPEYEYQEKFGGVGLKISWKEPLSCEISKNGAYIVCRGTDCLSPEEPCVDVATYLKCEAGKKEVAVQACNLFVEEPEIETVEQLKAYVKKEYEKRYHECYDDGDSVPLEKRLSIIDPENKYYMDIGDDLVMSVFGGVVRSSMDK